MGESINTPVADAKKILVTGAKGQLGKELKVLSSSFPEFDFIFLTKEDLPIHIMEEVNKVFKLYNPHYLINCAAYTAVDKAETEKDMAFRVNGEAVGVLASICKEYGAAFIHISTDYVFDGMATVPYKEDSPTNPQSVYGASKLEGERQAIQFNPASIIIRTSWVYSAFGKNFVKTMMKLMNEKEEINVVNDQLGSPTYAADIAATIMTIISSERIEPGIYNYSNNGIISWYDFALRIKEKNGFTCRVNPIPSSQFPTAAKRPAWSVLDNEKIQQTFSVKPKNWQDSLDACLANLR